MLFHEDEEGHVIIGEAVLQLALAGKDITVFSLLNELNHMAEDEISVSRQMDISDARDWLLEYAVKGDAEQSVPHLQDSAGPNEEKH
ncbi:hypothetical protein IBT49_23350 [Erwinia sp. S63]|uniref:hypothetical protein n=1 Tax=Erwinia sp. S63 TaxID=2769341 RepID=UPI00190DE80E|nr:hypothetical protein [Erwinia sp. S63]